MMSNSPLRLLLTLSFAVLLAACTSDSAETIVVGQDVADTASTTEAPATTQTTTTDPVADETIEVLGPAMVGIGDWAVIRPDSGDDVDCSNDGTLAYLLVGEVVHRYEALGGIGGVRLYNGARGQDAFVINCEESVERVLLQGVRDPA